jgi:hypothetical protein
MCPETCSLWVICERAQYMLKSVLHEIPCTSRHVTSSFVTSSWVWGLPSKCAVPWLVKLFADITVPKRSLQYSQNPAALWSLLTYWRSWDLPEKLPTVQPFRKFPAILRNPKVHHRVHKSPPLVPILSQLDPVHTIPSYLSKIHFNIIHPPTSWSS